MDRKEVEKLKVKVLERRNYLRGLDAQIPVTKRNLYGGMMSRLRRREDRRYFSAVKAQKIVYGKKLLDVNAYLEYLKEKDLIKPVGDGENGNGVVPIDPLVAPPLSRTGMGVRPFKMKVRHFPRGIRGRAERRRY